MPHRHPCGPGRVARQAHAALRPWSRGHRHHREARRGSDEPDRRRARLDRLARVRLRRVSILRGRSRDAVREAGQQRLLDRRSVRGVRSRQRDVRRSGTRRRHLDRCCAVELRGGDHLQGPQGRPGQADRAGRSLRHRRPGPSRGPVRPAHGRHRGGHRHRAAQARARREPRRRARRQRVRSSTRSPRSRTWADSTSPWCWPRLRASSSRHSPRFVEVVASCAWRCRRTAEP